MVVNTKKVEGRPKLHFDDLDQMLAYAEKLVNGGTKQLGNWSLGQNLQHLAMTENASIDGFPNLLAAPLRFLLKVLFKKRFLRNGLPPTGPKFKTLESEPIDAKVALANLRAATERVKKETKRSTNPGFGDMTLEEWQLLYLRHAELHLSFSVPTE